MNKFPFKVIAITDSAPGKFLAAKFVPSSGSTAKSMLGPNPVPNFSPIYSMGAWSNSPSPITTFPSIFNLFKFFLIESVAALSEETLSFLPIYLWHAIDALDVILTSLLIKFLSKFIIKF